MRQDAVVTFDVLDENSDFIAIGKNFDVGDLDEGMLLEVNDESGMVTEIIPSDGLLYLDTDFDS